MKARSILMTAWVLIASVTFANASDDNKLTVIQGNESGVFRVIFEGTEQGQSIVSVLDEEGNTIFSKNIKGQRAFILPMNFRGLESGEYVIEVKNGNDRWKEVVNYSPVASYNSTIQHVVVSKMKEDGKYVVCVSKTGNDAVSIDILDSNDDVLHAETREADGSLAVVYDVRNVFGEVKFRITDKAGYSKVIKM
jgi:hypothetical protein